MKEELLPKFLMSERLTLLYQYQHPDFFFKSLFLSLSLIKKLALYLYFFLKSLFLVQTHTREVGRAL